MTENETKASATEPPEITLEEHIRFAMQDHIDSLERELSHAKQREARLTDQLIKVTSKLAETTAIPWWRK